MARVRLATRLSLMMAGLSIAMTLSTILGLGAVIYWQTEEQMHTQLVTETNKLVTDYLELKDGAIILTSGTDVAGLATTLRLYGLNMQLSDRNLQTIAQYGVYRDMSSGELSQIMSPTDNSRYEDRRIPQFGTYDLYTVALKSGGETYGYLQVARLNTVLPTLLTTGGIMAGVMLPIVVLISFLFAYWSTGHTLSPLSKLVEYVEKLEPDKVGREIMVPETLDPETAMLTRSLNMMITRVKKVLVRQQEVAENISHEFKTPLTRIASSLQLLSGRVGKVEQRAIGRIEREVVTLGKSVDTILTVATEPKVRSEVQARTELYPLVQAEIASAPKTVKVRLWVKRDLWVPVAASQLQVVVRNVLDNAIKYSRPKEQIQIRAASGLREWYLEVTNVVGVSTAKSHGLGLVIVRRICERQGLTLTMDQTDPAIMSVRVSGKLGGT